MANNRFFTNLETGCERIQTLNCNILNEWHCLLWMDIGHTLMEVSFSGFLFDGADVTWSLFGSLVAVDRPTAQFCAH